jgi:hypothetical protein
MPRQDIDIDPSFGEVNTTDGLTNKVIYDFALLSRVKGADNDLYAYGEITVPQGFESRYSESTGIHIVIPYTPSYKQLRVRFRVDSGSGDTEYLVNPADNLTWFSVYRENEEGEIAQVRLAEFAQVNGNGNFNLLLRRGYLALYSGEETDFVFRPALRQNEVFLLKASAGNLYQHPTTGVGLIDFLHGNFENTGLAGKLQSEFAGDKMIINNAYMDSATGEILLDVTEKDG